MGLRAISVLKRGGGLCIQTGRKDDLEGIKDMDCPLGLGGLMSNPAVYRNSEPRSSLAERHLHDVSQVLQVVRPLALVESLRLTRELIVLGARGTLGPINQAGTPHAVSIARP